MSMQRHLANMLRASGTVTPSAPDGLILGVRTTTDNESFTIPCQNVGVFDAVLDWGDNSESTVTEFDSANLAHVYETAGDYEILITGLFPNVYFNATGDRLKVLSCRSSSSTPHPFLRANYAFNGCNNMASQGIVDLSTLTGFSLESAWSTTQMQSFPWIDVSKVTSFRRCWRQFTKNEATGLKHFPANMFDNMAVPVFLCFADTWLNCVLTATSVENILTSIVTGGRNAPVSSPNISISTEAGYVETATITDAKATLAARGWTFVGV